MPASLNWPVNVSVGWGHNSVYVTIGILLSRCFGVVFSLDALNTLKAVLYEWCLRDTWVFGHILLASLGWLRSVFCSVLYSKVSRDKGTHRAQRLAVIHTV